jgi:protein-S-isoprenylcysteine O-methyltransferase Ste14
MSAAKAGLAAWIGYDLLKLAQFLLAGFGGAVEFVLVAALAVTLINVLRRPRPLATRLDAASLLACAVSLGLFDAALALTDLPFAAGPATEVLGLAAAMLLLAGVVALGPSFSILPAAISVRTAGPFALVRHPIYTAYMLSSLGIAIGYRNWLIGAAAALDAAALVWRAALEERLLAHTLPEYVAYRLRTRYRFLPGLY